MGLYDTFHYTCPSCGKETASQTKLGECVLRSLTIGSDFPEEGIIMMKNPCEHCGKNNVVVVENNIIIMFEKSNLAEETEGLWGSKHKISGGKNAG